MDVSVDIGKNITGLLEKLAQQIGTTVDKVYPWYVQQAYNEGLTTLIAFGCVFVLAVSIFAVALRAVIKDNSNEVAGGITIVSGIVLVCTTIFGTFESVSAARKIMNPNYYAMSMLTRDIGRMVGK